MNRKILRIVIIVVLILAIFRLGQIMHSVKDPDVRCYNELAENISLDREVIEKLIKRAESEKSQWRINPLTSWDYLKVFFFMKDLDPEVSIVKYGVDHGGYRVSFYGFKQGRYVIFSFDESFNITSVKFEAKT